jgi:hypothetical protein
MLELSQFADLVFVLLRGRIWDGPRWHDARTNFPENRYRHSKVCEGRIYRQARVRTRRRTRACAQQDVLISLLLLSKNKEIMS